MLADYGFDSLQDDPELEKIARFAAKLCDTPVALVSLVDHARQRFLAAQGLAATETSRDVSFCSYAMLQDDLMQVFDASLDPLFAANPLGQEVFSNGKERLNFALDPGQSVTFRHRLLLFAGAVTPERMEAQYKRFAGGREPLAH